jgi:hypothetical protein|nr:MAG TPA: hypothetical protein [Caudoviricetes sp.]
MSKTIHIKVPDGKKAAWQKIDGKTVLVMVDEKDNRPVTERIKTFEDACNELGENHPMVSAYNSLITRANGGQSLVEWMGKDVVAFLKLRIITEALNEGWHPKFTEDEFRYYPWFYFYTTEGYNNFSEVVKIRCVGRANYDANANGGPVFSNALYASSRPKPDNGVCFVFSNRDLAEYAGMQFIDIWTDFVFKSNDNNKQ